MNYTSGNVWDQSFEQRSKNGSSGKQRAAMLLAGGSAMAYGIWKRDRLGWPVAVGGALLLVRAATQPTTPNSPCEVSYTINRSPSDVFGFWKDANNWPLFMNGLKSARFEPPDEIIWELSESKAEGRSKIVETVPDRLIRWTSSSEGRSHDCVIEFKPAPGDRGTEVFLRIEPTTPQNPVMAAYRRTTGRSMEQEARESLRALKQLLEAGEIPSTDGQSHGSRGMRGKSARLMFRENVSEERRPPRTTEQPEKQWGAF